MVARVHIIGVGMGNPATLTVQARDLLEAATLVIGSPRLVEGLADLRARTVALVGAKRIARALAEAEDEEACVVMSGDVGFHSGARSLIAELEAQGAQGAPGPACVDCVPGISSVAYLAARLRRPWEDAFLASSHGCDLDVAAAVASHKTCFIITGSAADASVAGICRRLTASGLGHVTVHVGERLSYADERISSGRADELMDRDFSGLSTIVVDNPRPRPLVPATTPVPHLADASFERGRVPMTKREVRALVVSRLAVAPTDTVWDVGAGTGSVSVEAAHAAWRGRVLAIERNLEACALIEANARGLDAPNVEVIAGTAPEALHGLPTPDCVFVGGSAGRLAEIVAAALAANPAARLCLTAVTLETLARAVNLADELGLLDLDVCQVSVTRAETHGHHRMLKSENPVFIVSARGGGERP